MGIVIGILLLGFIVMVHELGHYLVGRLCGLGIEEFSIGFGPKLVQWGKQIKYSIRCIPMGGYVRFLGEDQASDDPKAFNNGAVWKRFLTVFAGAFMNFVLAFVVTLFIVMALGVYENVPKVGGFVEGVDLSATGLRMDDRIVALDGTEFSYDFRGYQAFDAALRQHAQKDVTAPLDLIVERGGEQMALSVPMTQMEDGKWLIGIYIGTERVPMGLIEGVSYSARYIVDVMGEMLNSLRRLFFKGEGLNEMSGAVGIVSVMSEGVKQGFETILSYIILISLNLGIINLLPLPALDGGRLVFLIIEGIRRKPVPRDKEGMVHLIGMALLLVLFVVLTYKDIMRLITGA